jgi:hypothetical protein
MVVHQNSACPVDMTYVVYVNGSSTALTVTVLAGSIAVSIDSTHTVAVSQGDRIQLVSSNGSATGSNTVYYPQGTVSLA